MNKRIILNQTATTSRSKLDKKKTLVESRKTEKYADRESTLIDFRLSSFFFEREFR